MQPGATIPVRSEALPGSAGIPGHVVSIQRIGLSVFGAIAVIGGVLAVATAWLFLTNPVTVANSVNEGDVTPFVRDLAQVLWDALQGLLKYL
jgi:hypothetical protein